MKSKNVRKSTRNKGKTRQPRNDKTSEKLYSPENNVKLNKKSLRKKRQKTNLKKSFNCKLADSAYGSDKSITPNTFQDISIDPYDASLIEDIPVEQAKSKRNRQTLCNRKMTRQRSLLQKAAKPAKSQVNSTSTPVQQNENGGTASSNQQKSNDLSLVTPEVTPILPAKPLECASENFLTPQLPRSTRKRDFAYAHNTSKHVNNNGDNDSGILSPPPAKKKLADTLDKWKLMEDESQSKHISNENNFVTIKPKDKKTVLSNHFCNNVNIQANLSTKLQSEDRLEQSNSKLKDSCFGFDSIESPKISLMHSLKNTPNLSSVTCQSHLSSSALSEECDLHSQDTEAKKPHSSSPLLFTGDVYDTQAENLEVNKSSCKSYKSLSFRKLKCKLPTAKIDAWASSFNKDIEETEKYDFYIE